MSAEPAAGGESTLRLGSAPDSWGVWLADDPRQMPWTRFLDEFAEVGFRWLELGPHGYLPTDPVRLGEELSRRGIRVAGGDTGGSLHHAGTWDSVLAAARPVAELTSALGGEYLVFLPDMYRSLDDGSRLEDSELTDAQWESLTTGVSRLGRTIADDYGLRLVFHNHADSHVRTQEHVIRLLEATDAPSVWLCLDTGHLAFDGGDSLALVERFGDRIGCLHIKQIDPSVLARVRAEDMSFARAVSLGVMCDPPRGEPDLEPVLRATAGLGRPIFAIVEQDMFPCDPAAPLPIALRTRRYLAAEPFRL